MSALPRLQLANVACDSEAVIGVSQAPAYVIDTFNAPQATGPTQAGVFKATA